MARVRVVRFDVAHGGRYLFTSRGGALIRAVDTDFIGGYGRSPGQAGLLRSGPVIGRFTGCRFELIELDWTLRLGAGSALLFEGCRFEVKAPDPTRSPNDKLRFDGCSFIVIPRDTPQEEQRKDLADLFHGA